MCTAGALTVYTAGMNIDRNELDRACLQLKARLLVLFGSRAGGRLVPREESDVDVAIAFQRGVRPPPRHVVHDALSELFDAPLDLAFLAGADPLFRWEIMERGVLLWGDEDDFLEFRAFAYRDFVDSADLRRLEQRLFEKKMERMRQVIRAAS